MADLHDPRIAVTGTIQTPGVTFDGHHHEPSPKLSGSDAHLQSSLPPEMAYNERQLITLIRMMRSAAEGKHHELDVIASQARYAYPDFSKALESFVTRVEQMHKDGVRIDNQRELYQRLYTAEQMKTQALMEHQDI